MGHIADDYALAQFLALLHFFQTVLIQDAAVLYCRYPESGIFQHSPFNTTMFKDFAMASTSQIEAAEEAARHQFKNLLEHLIASLHGIVTMTNMEQHQEQEEHQLQYNEITAQNQTLINLVLELYNNQSGKWSKGLSKGKCILLIGRALHEKLTVHLVPNVAPVLTMSTQPSLQGSAVLPNINTSNTNRDLVVVTLGAGQAESVLTEYYVCHPSNADVPVSSPLSSASELSDKQQRAMEALETKYSTEHVQKHSWKWVTYFSKQDDKWVPTYILAKKLSLEDTYAEYATGWQGCLSIKMLRDAWEAKWQFGNHTQISEATHHAKLYHLVEALKIKNANWRD